ncbi:MAG TPA: tetratricopeptide repeat protein [Drouetiella sp.]
MKVQISLIASLFLGLASPALCANPAANSYDPNDKVMAEALKLYNKGEVERAIPLFLQDLKENPNNGTAHYYLGMALKRSGADANAISELEMAAKLLPVGISQDLAKRALHGAFVEDPPPSSSNSGVAPVASGAAVPQQENFFSSIFNFFQPPSKTPKPVPKVAVAPPPPPSFMPLPDLSGALDGTKHWIRDQSKSIKKMIKNKPAQNARPQSSTNGDVIPMGEMLNLADDSRTLSSKLQSHPSGVVTFEQAPENSAEWDAWIRRFRRTFDSQVFRHLMKEAKSEKNGTASVIFSVDRQGHLRGCVYTATADTTLQNCLLQAIRELDQSYVLAFPPDSRISGWNFRMNWNFGKALAFVNAVRDARAKEAAKVAVIDVNAMIKQKQAEAALQAKAKLLAEKKKAALKTKVAVKTPPPPVVKTDVNAQLIKPVELKATPMKLSDMPPLPKNAPKLTTQDVDDFVILNKDVSGLFH